RAPGKAGWRMRRARRGGRSTCAEAPPEEERGPEDDRPGDDVVETAQLVLQVLPVIAEEHPRPDQEHHPGHGADDRKERETPQRPARDARRYRAERADD